MSDRQLLVRELPQNERDLLAELAHVPWYSMQTAAIYERTGDKSLRSVELFVRADKIVGIRSIEDEVAEDGEEISRIAVRHVQSSTTSSYEARATVLTGENSLLHPLELLPRPARVAVLSRRLEVFVSENSSMTVVTPYALLLEGARGRLLISQDDLPAWIRLEWDPGAIKQALKAAEAIQDFS